MTNDLAFRNFKTSRGGGVPKGVKVVKAVIGSSSSWSPAINGGHPYHCDFRIPLLPPSVNHYVKHPVAGVHYKTREAKGFEDAFAIFARDQYVVSASGRFAVTLAFTPGPRDSGDVDNYNKLPLDCVAKRGMLRDKKGNAKSDAWVKRLLVIINDSPEDRKRGPETMITIEAMQ